MIEDNLITGSHKRIKSADGTFDQPLLLLCGEFVVTGQLGTS